MTQPVILVPVKAAVDALITLPVAKVLADIEGASLRVLHVAAPETAGTLPFDREGIPELQGLPLDERTGESAGEILSFASEMHPQLIVMGMRGAAAEGKGLGKTATAVLRNADCLVVLVPPERGPTPWRLHHVLVPHDGAPATSGAVRSALEIAERSGAEVLLAHVASTRPAPSEPGSIAPSRYADQPHHEWPAWTDEFINRFVYACPCACSHLRIVVATGDPPTEIVQLATKQSTDLIVLAWRGEWEGGHAAIVKGVLDDAVCPVAITRA